MKFHSEILEPGSWILLYLFVYIILIDDYRSCTQLQFIHDSHEIDKLAAIYKFIFICVFDLFSYLYADAAITHE